MGVNTVILNGNSVQLNIPDIKIKGACRVSLPGMFNNQHTTINLDDETLSKHTLLIGATGTGKTNTFYYYIEQLKKQMNQNDVMIVFDTKGDFERKFYNQGDVIIGNSKKYKDITEKWNIYKELVVDGFDEDCIQMNTNEITYSLFKDAMEKTNQQFFPSAARDLLASIILAHLKAGKDLIGKIVPVRLAKSMGFYYMGELA